MHRLDRRLTILRGKRNGSYDPDQLYLADAPRTRAIRRLRTHLRRMDPVVLKCPRWGQTDDVLDDVSVDLALGTPDVYCKMLSLAPMKSRPLVDNWSFLVQAIMEFCDLAIEGPAAQAVNRHGFRSVMGHLLRRTVHSRRCALLLHGTEHLHIEALEDLVYVFSKHLQEAGEARKINFLFAGSVRMPDFELPGTVFLRLPDFGRQEAIEHLRSYVGVQPPGPINRALEIAGGVPALLDCLGEAALDSGFGSSHDDHRKALTPLMEELRGALELVHSDQKLAERIEDIGRFGVMPREDIDEPLISAGILVKVKPEPMRVALRAPVFLHLLNGRN